MKRIALITMFGLVLGTAGVAIVKSQANRTSKHCTNIA